MSDKIDRSIIEKSLDAKKIKETINSSIKQLEDQKEILKESRLSNAQVKNIDNHLKKMRE
jgi:hypothetical protein